VFPGKRAPLTLALIPMIVSVTLILGVQEQTWPGALAASEQQARAGFPLKLVPVEFPSSIIERMDTTLRIPACILLGYLAGSLPFGLWVTYLLKRRDIRDGGSGHITTTNTIRQAGWLPGALVLVLDITKGCLPTALALRLGLPWWAVALTAALAVAGHCWPLFAQFRGGMGLATTGGAMLAVSPLGFLIILGVLVASVLVLRHSARGALLAGLAGPLTLWLVGLRGVEFWVGLAAGLVLAARFTIDWNRKYRELWLDREQAG
jgi:glycerol-3-phosphate acyltransferase PlsY